MEKIRKIISVILCCAALLGCMTVYASAAENGTAVMPRYNNVAASDTDFTISDDVAYIFVAYRGYEGVTTGATIKVTLQKKFLLFFWQDVTSWTLTPNTVMYSNTLTYPISSGTHKVTVEYQIYGNAGATDVITEEFEKKN